MQDSSVSTLSTSRTQHGSEWTAHELATLETFAHGPANAKKLLEALPGRTMGAIRVRLAHMRRSMGIAPRHDPLDATYEQNRGPAMLDPDDPGLAGTDWRKKQRHINAKADAAFLNAIARLVA